MTASKATMDAIDDAAARALIQRAREHVTGMDVLYTRHIITGLADALEAALAVVEAVRARYDCGCPGHPQKHYYWCKDVTNALAAYDARLQSTGA